MKKIALITFVLFGFLLNAQIHDPVTWKTSVNKISDTEYELTATATIEEGWHLYSQSVPEDGPRPTVFTFESSPNFLKKGNTKEGKGHEVNDPIFEMLIKYFDTKAAFKQRIKLKTDNKTFEIKGTVEFMVCNDTMCLPPKEVDLVFNIN
ncbi:protein-disulfide reductase DsbD domain-containing protein [Flavivirga eckloniae]|uniref:Cytochrome C biogenesis protein n=1 Tax=Flavivirga eckloniae TaxID=1803846 RepID=A0A2K9PSG0_9FLAO|nr:protein-disulfide reductase DsbD domain-containing protein [Flavivirga eckloniae]AUP79979.1 cytochrome C biogenesis protein [Flavivirga eckloniae]